MDLEFIAELDRDLSNLGSDKVWTRTIGGVELHISPLTLIGQEKVAETIANSELGAAIVAESKRMTLAHAIVGIGKRDLREFRHGPAVFPSKGRDGKPVKVPLEKYMHDKLALWGHEFVDNLFDVYADLMETHKRENLKDIKFDHLKTPAEELAELMVRVAELRQQLDLPPLVAATEQDLEEEKEQKAEEAAVKGFDPFSTPEVVEKEDEADTVVVGDLPPDIKPKYAPRAPYIPTGASNLGPPDLNLKFPEEQEEAAAEIEAEFARAQPTPAPARTRDDVLESPTKVVPVEPPVIDKVAVPRNPRFAVPSK